MYELLYRLVISRIDAERAHHLAHLVIRLLPYFGGFLVRRLTRARPEQAVEALGLRFESPLGVAAGFDKDAASVRGLWQLGFGHIEVGTITAQAQPGNEKPRMFRLAEDRAIINRMGFNNKGAAVAVAQLTKLRRRSDRPVIGVNIGKTRTVAVADALEDYRASTRLLAPLADYLVVNVSSPNTPGLRGLQDRELLGPLLTAVKADAGDTPLLVKIAPDLADEDVLDVVRLAQELDLDGIIATNTTIGRESLKAAPALVAEAGGLSGPPLAQRSLEVLRLIRSIAPAEFCVISVGGVQSPVDLRERLDAGATLVQGYTAFIYEGPLWARAMNRGLAALRRG